MSGHLVRVWLLGLLVLGANMACDRDTGCGQVATDYRERCCEADAGADCPSRSELKSDCNSVFKYCNDPSATCALAKDGAGDPICDRTTTYIKCWPCEGPSATPEE